MNTVKCDANVFSDKCYQCYQKFKFYEQKIATYVEKKSFSQLIINKNEDVFKHCSKKCVFLDRDLEKKLLKHESNTNHL